MIRVVVCESRAVVRTGLTAVFRAVSDAEIIGFVTDPRGLPSVVDQFSPDVVLVSADAPGIGAARVRALPRQLGDVPIVMLVAAADDEIIDVLLDGVRGALPADTDPADILTCVRVVAGGGAMLAPPIAARLIDRILETPVVTTLPPDAVFGSLSGREREVLRLLAGGSTHDEIATALSISAVTVRSHLHHVVTKLNLRHRAQAVALAYRAGLVTE